MIQLAIKYFIRFGQLDIPSVGQLKLSIKEAELIKGVLIAPKEYIEFEQCTIMPSKQFYQYLANALDISADQATIQYEQFWNKSFQEGAVVNIGNLGNITKNEHDYSWHASFDSSNYYNNLEIEQLPIAEIIEDIQEEQRNDKWIIWAIVFTSIALLAILLKQ